MKTKLLLLLLCLLCNLVLGQQSGGSLPGGLMFPMLSNAALTNAAALTADWMYKAQVLYSPPIKEDEPNAYLAGFAKASERFGFNVGYSGSSHLEETMHNAFAALATKIGRLSLGVSVKKLDLMGPSPVTWDISAIYHLGRNIRLGYVNYDVGNSKQSAIGLGIGKPYTFTLNVDFLLPSSFSKEEISTEYAASGAITFYLGRLGFSGGVHYSQMPFECEDQNLSWNAGFLIQLSNSWSIMALGNTHPQSVSVGITWTGLPSTQQYINFFQKKNRKK